MYNFIFIDEHVLFYESKKFRDFSGYFGKWHFLSLGIFHRQKSNFGKITLCSYSINIDVIVN